MRLFIAEKPSVAKAIAAELGVANKTGSSIECRDGSTVTWCFGHLLEQAEPDDYLPDDVPKTKKGKKIWRLEDLPIFPTEWKTYPKSDAGVKKQLSAIGKLIKSADRLVNAGDPDREGQLLVDEVIEHFKSRKPVERFWVSAVDPASIRKGLQNLKANEPFSGMRDAARGRSRADWLLGMNLSRAYTLSNKPADGKGELIAVGRVQTPTLTMVARRDYAVKNFKPQPYLAISAALSSKGKAFTAKWRPRPDQPGMDEEGKLPNIKGALLADAVATTAGAVLGTSTTTTFVESASGVSEGGRTGLTAVTTAILFGLSLFLSPIFLAIPSFATAPALVIVGLYMLSNVISIDFSDMSEAIPCYVCIIAMPFFYSISEGISMGIITYVAINLITGKAKEKKISALM